MGEIFRPVEGHPGYYVSNQGRFLSKKRDIPVIMSTRKSRLGYVIGLMWKGKQLCTVYLGRAVLAAFRGYPADPWLCYCHHKDGDLENCKLENLEWIVCETTDEYDPSKSHRKGVLKPDFTKQRMTESKLKQSKETIEKAVISRKKTIEVRNMLKAQDRLNGK